MLLAPINLISTDEHGVVYAHQMDVSIGQCITDLAFLSLAGMPEDFTDQIYFLPL